MAYRTIGNTVVEWDDNQPFVFTMSQSVGSLGNKAPASITIDLFGLRNGFEDAFLMHLKEHLIERPNRVALTTIATEFAHLKSLFTKVVELDLFDTKVGVIDEAFLLCLSAAKEGFGTQSLRHLKQTFRANYTSRMFAIGLHATDFPVRNSKKGSHGSLIDRVLAKALSQAAVANILDLCDVAYAQGKIDIGRYAFAHLAFAVFCRPNSYRQICLSDLHYDTESKQYSIQIIASKTGQNNPSKVHFLINEPLGVLLTKQRQHVIKTYGHLIASEDVDKLALFPTRRRTWDIAKRQFCMIESGSDFSKRYPEAIRKKINAEPFTLQANALRHTVGTLLAQTGASSKTIQAVLKHATDVVCNAYVDIAFHGMMKELSDAMHPAFMDHLPGLLNFLSKDDQGALEKRIWSEDIETGRSEVTGECGNAIACDKAPIVCYSCFRFRPCWDADHGINLAIIQREIDDMSTWGKPWEHMGIRATTAKNRILLVMNAADRYRDAMKLVMRA